MKKWNLFIIAVLVPHICFAKPMFRCIDNETGKITFSDRGCSIKEKTSKVKKSSISLSDSKAMQDEVDYYKKREMASELKKRGYQDAEALSEQIVKEERDYIFDSSEKGKTNQINEKYHQRKMADEELSARGIDPLQQKVRKIKQAENTSK